MHSSALGFTSSSLTSQGLNLLLGQLEALCLANAPCISTLECADNNAPERDSTVVGAHLWDAHRCFRLDLKVATLLGLLLLCNYAGVNRVKLREKYEIGAETSVLTCGALCCVSRCLTVRSKGQKLESALVVELPDIL
jgi:hypothetical protein